MSRLERAPPPAECAACRLDLCRLAVDAPPDRRVAELAAHARACSGCATWMDELLRARTFLEGAAAPPAPPGVAELAGRAAAALRRELAARLARDLQDDAQGRAGRALPLRRRDLRRVIALDGAGALRGDPWRGVVRLALRSPRPSPVRRAAALRLAARMDPLGLDLALGHLAALERDGRRSAADAEADRLLELVG